MNENTPETPQRNFSLLTAAILTFVILHFLFTLVVPFAFIYEVKPVLHFAEYAFDIWLCQPVVIAVLLVASRSTSQVCRTLVYIDVVLSFLQKFSVVLLYGIADKIG
jgi:hypothetical protein